MINRVSGPVTAVFTAILLAAPAGVLAADAGKEAATAAQHAGFAAKSGKIEQVHMHLHHAVNCLVGPNGDGFDASQANPCGSQGNGAIPDAGDAVMKQKLEDALTTAKSGLATDDMTAAQQAASDTRNILGSGM